MLTQMAKYLDTVYVSGWQSSSTASSTDEPSPDLADYPMVSSFASAIYRNCVALVLIFDAEHRPQQGKPVVHGTAVP
jgi:isocitrate lyase